MLSAKKGELSCQCTHLGRYSEKAASPFKDKGNEGRCLTLDNESWVSTRNLKQTLENLSEVSTK
jgi:hypothetical protein